MWKLPNFATTFFLAVIILSGCLKFTFPGVLDSCEWWWVFECKVFAKKEELQKLVSDGCRPGGNWHLSALIAVGSSCSRFLWKPPSRCLHEWKCHMPTNTKPIERLNVTREILNAGTEATLWVPRYNNVCVFMKPSAGMFKRALWMRRRWCNPPDNRRHWWTQPQSGAVFPPSSKSAAELNCVSLCQKALLGVHHEQTLNKKTTTENTNLVYWS